MVVQIKDKDDLDSKLNDAGDTLVIVEFFATWCKPCKEVGPKLEQLAKELPDIQVVKVDVNECEDLAMEYNVSLMPTYVLIKNKNVILTFAGADFDKLKKIITEQKGSKEQKVQK